MSTAESIAPTCEFPLGSRARVVRPGHFCGQVGEVWRVDCGHRLLGFAGQGVGRWFHVRDLRHEPEFDLGPVGYAAEAVVNGAARLRPVPVADVSEIAAGAAAWQALEPRRREVMIGVRGHVVTVTASRSRQEDGHTAKFLGPMRPEAVGFALDLVIANADPKPISFGGSEPLERDEEVCR